MHREEFERLAIENLDAVYRLAFHLTRNPDEAADLVQDAYARALRPESVEGFRTRGGGMRAWLFTIVHNLFYTSRGRARRGPVGSLGLDGHADDSARPDEPPPAWDRAALDWDHVDERIKAAIEGLGAEHREVLLMWGADGLKYREIAAILGVPIGTVMSRLHRARQILADHLAPGEAPREPLGKALDNAKGSPREATR